MLIKFSASFGSAWKKAYLKVATVIVSLAIIGLLTIGNYGVSWDENVEISMVRFNFELITQGKPIPVDYKYYGTAFNLTSEIIFQIQSFIQKGFDYNPLNDAGIPDERLKYKVLYERIKVKHVLTFLVSLITLCIASRTCRDFMWQRICLVWCCGFTPDSTLLGS
jgi:hypothetical protein